MDPLHPETAVPRIKELSKQLDRVLSDFKKATTTGKLAELEREGILVVQEMSLVAPRLHEVVMQTSRSQRTAIARGISLGIRTQYEQPSKPVEKSQEKCEKEAPKQPEKCDETEVKPVKPKAKKTTKKAKK